MAPSLRNGAQSGTRENGPALGGTLKNSIIVMMSQPEHNINKIIWSDIYNDLGHSLYVYRYNK